MSVSAEEHQRLKNEYDEFREASSELEEGLEEEINNLKQMNLTLTKEADMLRSKRRREMKEAAEAQERLEQHAEDLAAKQKALRERVRGLEVEQEGWDRERRQAAALVARTQQANEELQEEIVLLQGELRDAADAKAGLSRRAQRLEKELAEAQTAAPKPPPQPQTPPAKAALSPATSTLSPACTPQHVTKYTSILRDVQQALTDAFHLEPEWGHLEHELLDRMAVGTEVRVGGC
eukprot:TRINITY_DN22856_c0_g1_i1.p1 TRINITY_DN22856_c0_g1~~TRINITY_DN22856_c0_g1_i1.p1  ORF type:complete len:235 (+),score=122.49 TRINITY_DN22856_c0_g1_i1:87-791(+)